MTSVVVHLFVVLGVSFVLPSQARNRQISPPLKITIVATPTERAAAEARLLAQLNSLGEDEASELSLASVVSAGRSGNAAAQDKERMLVEEQSKARFNPETPEVADNGNNGQTREQLTESINIAFLNAQAKPRELYVSANARASEVAPYLENWRILIERVGNLNYPDAAKQLALEGDLVMDVTVNSEGQVLNVDILRSSGHKILDDGAERIVHIAAPFDRFSPEMMRDYDILHVIRTWKFSQNKVSGVHQ